MNAFRDIIGFAGKAADGLLTGGAITGARRRNQFTDLLSQGQFDQAAAFASQNNEPQFAQIAQNQGALAGQRTAAAQKRQQDQAAVLGRVAQFGDSLAPEQRLAFAQSIAPILQSQFDLDDEDTAAIIQAAGLPQGFGALASAFIDPNQQIQNQFEGQRIAETGRSNRASEGLRGAEIDVSRGNLQLGRDRLGFDRERAPNSDTLDRTKLDREVFKDTQSLRKEFSQVTSDFRDAEGSFNRIKALANQGTSQGDLALLVAFTKLLDPGSVAREGEVQLTQSSASAVQQALNLQNRFIEGKTILPKEVRQRFVQAADEIFKQYERSFDLRKGEFQRFATEGGLNPESVVLGRTPTIQTPTALPEGVTEEDIAFTMQRHGVSREEVLQRLGGQ